MGTKTIGDTRQTTKQKDELYPFEERTGSWFLLPEIGRQNESITRLNEHGNESLQLVGTALFLLVKSEHIPAMRNVEATTRKVMLSLL